MLSGYKNYNYFAFLFLLPQENYGKKWQLSKRRKKVTCVWLCVRACVRVCVWVKERRVSACTSLSLSLSPLAVLRIRKIRIPLPSFFALHAHARTHTHTLSLIFLCLDRIRWTQGEFFSGLLQCLSPGCSQSVTWWWSLHTRCQLLHRTTKHAKIYPVHRNHQLFRQ